jgi:hypothetical protein
MRFGNFLLKAVEIWIVRISLECPRDQLRSLRKPSGLDVLVGALRHS